jgi:hypothetical protein
VGTPPSVTPMSGGVWPSGVILTSDHPFWYTFSVTFDKKSVAGFGRRLFWACIGGIDVISLPKIGRYRPVTGGKAGLGRGLGWGLWGDRELGNFYRGFCRDFFEKFFAGFFLYRNFFQLKIRKFFQEGWTLNGALPLAAWACPID